MNSSMHYCPRPQGRGQLCIELSTVHVPRGIVLTILPNRHEITVYTPGIYAEGYIVFVFPFVRSYVRMFVRSFVHSFVRSYFLPSRGICVKVLR